MVTTISAMNKNENVRGSATSLEQQRLWVLNELEHARTAFNVSVSVFLKGRLDTEALQASIHAVLDANPILDSRFTTAAGELVQTPAPRPSEILKFVDLTSIPESDREDRLQRLAMHDQATAFDLEAEPAFRATLLALGRHNYALFVTTHQIVCDSDSASILLNEIAQHYSRIHRSSKVTVQPKTQYAEYAAWQKEYLGSEACAGDFAFWRRQLEGLATAVELPTDYARPPEPSFRGNTCTLEIPDSLRAELHDRRRLDPKSLRVLLLSAFVTLLCRYTGLEDIILGTELPGRTIAGAHTCIGPFKKHIPLRINTSGNPLVRDFMDRVQQACTDADSHQALPFSKMLSCLPVGRDLSRNPVFQVRFVSERVPDLPAFAGLQVAALPVNVATEMLDLSLRVTEKTDGTELSFSYSAELFSGETVERMGRHFLKLLSGMCFAADSHIFDLPMLADSERRQLLSDWNSTQLPYPKTCIQDLCTAQAQRSPAAEAVRFGDQTLTYAELNLRSNQLAHYLRKRGIGSNSLIGIYLERSLEIPIALLGVLKAGAGYVPLDPAYPRDRIAFILQDANVELILLQEKLRESLPVDHVEMLCLDSEWSKIAAEDKSDPQWQVLASDLAYVLYTSGSTGKPKGVEIEHRSVVNFLTSMRIEPGFESKDVLLAVTTLSFDIAGLELYLPLVCGGTIVMATREQASDGNALRRLLDSGVTIMQATPATWRLLLESGWPGNSQLRILCGGEALPRELAQELLPRCSELWNMYGPTETTIWSSVYRVRDVSWSMAPIGKPIGNTQMYVLDKSRRLLPPAVAGELYIGGDGLARGYRNRPDLTAERFLANPFSNDPSSRLYLTGDLVRYLPDGNLQYLGRIDNQVKVRGFRIELGEIESVLTQNPAIRQAAVLVRELSGDKQIVAYVSAQPGHTVDASEMRSFARQKLPEYMVPSQFVTLDQFPLTPNGKVDRKSLPAPARESLARATEAPADELEWQLLSLFENVLGVDQIGVTDDFFELGGHSLKAARLMSEIRTLTGKQLPLNTLFHGATIRYLRKALAEEARVDAQKTLTSIQVGKPSVPPFFAVISPGESGLGYAILARHMGHAFPFYQLQASTPIAIERPYTWSELDNLAAEYVEDMRTVQPSGPYYFGGMCDGAHIAIRMARRLEQAGETVGMLAIFDTWVLENSQHPLLWKLAYYSERWRQVCTWGWPERFALASRVAGRAARKLVGKQGRGAWTQAYWPDKGYVPPDFRGRVTLFRRPKQPYYYKRDALMGWGDRARGGVDAVVLPLHHEHMLREPSVQVLAKCLVGKLENAFAGKPTRVREQRSQRLEIPAAASASGEVC